MSNPAFARFLPFSVSSSSFADSSIHRKRIFAEFVLFLFSSLWYGLNTVFPLLFVSYHFVDDASKESQLWLHVLLLHSCVFPRSFNYSNGIRIYYLPFGLLIPSFWGLFSPPLLMYIHISPLLLDSAKHYLAFSLADASYFMNCKYFWCFAWRALFHRRSKKAQLTPVFKQGSGCYCYSAYMELDVCC